MKLSMAWLREWIKVSLDAATLCERLTMAGLEVDAVKPVADEFSGVVIGEIMTVVPHPNADKLRVCQVNVDRSEPLTIVTGASNVQAGMRIPVALVDAVLKNGTFPIKKAKLRGIDSFGMMCSAVELGLAEESPGIMPLPLDAPLGADVRNYLQLDDVVIDIDLTPNRGDCASVLGVAREVAALTGTSFSMPTQKEVVAVSNEKISVRVEEKMACPHYVGRVLRDIRLDRTTPLWLIEKLRRAGLRSIDPVVDVMNVVMLELGQPLHAFDLMTLQGDVVVRFAKPQERLRLLDDREVTLKADALVIADDKNVLAIAGVMGGKDSGVSPATQHLFIESAYFTPDVIAGKSREYTVNSDAAYRFERGVDPTLQRTAIERATSLLLEIVGGTPGPVIEVGHAASSRSVITLRASRVCQALGITISIAEIATILRALSMTVVEHAKELEVTPPGFRFDIHLEADLIEEVARVYGLDRIPARMPSVPLHLPMAKTSSFAGFSDQLVALGYHEVMTYSFVDPAWQTLLDPTHEALQLSNPIASDMSVMRTTLWAGLLQALSYNEHRQQEVVRLFETGLCFIPEAGQVQQCKKIAGLIYGRAKPLQWADEKRDVDFYDVKGDIEIMLSLTGRAFTFVPSQMPALHPGQSADIIDATGHRMGAFGLLHPSLCERLKISTVFVFELELKALTTTVVPRYQAISKFPSVSRDLAFIVQRKHSAHDILNTIREVGSDKLIDVVLFDIYRDAALGEDYQSLALRLLFQDQEATLSDELIANIMQTIIARIADNFQAKIRE